MLVLIDVTLPLLVPVSHLKHVEANIVDHVFLVAIVHGLVFILAPPIPEWIRTNLILKVQVRICELGPSNLWNIAIRKAANRMSPKVVHLAIAPRSGPTSSVGRCRRNVIDHEILLLVHERERIQKCLRLVLGAVPPPSI